MKNKKILIIFVIAILLCLLGTTYAFFNYYKIGSNQEIIAGKVALEFVEDVDTISLTNVFPETTEEARKRDDNFVTFTISGTNTTTNKDIFYQIMLNEGADEDGKKRFKPNELVFDLVEIDENKNETYLVDAMYFNDFNAQRIWVDIVEREETTGINKTYKLRMWINDNVLVSDSYPNADYTTDEFANGYASVKVTVQGDFKEKASPYNYMKRFGGTFDINNEASEPFWPTEIQEGVSAITEVRFMSMEKEMLDMLASEGAFDLTDTTKSPAGSVIAVPAMDSQLWIMSEGITMLPEDCSAMFAGFTNLTQIYFNNISTKYVKNMHAMFYGIWDISNINVGSFDTENVTNMSYMFYQCGNLLSLDVGSWDTSQVTNTSNMFYNCQNLANLDVGNWDTSSVSDMSVMFQFCWSLTNLDVGFWNTSQVTNMSNLFYQCGKLKSLDVGAWDTSSVSNMSFMFWHCDNLINLDIGDWNTNNVTNMRRMFYNCSSLSNLDIKKWNTSNVTNMAGMFDDCSGLTSLNISNFIFDGVTSYDEIFDGMQARTDNTPTIIVKNATAQNWILALTSSNRPESWTTENVIIG